MTDRSLTSNQCTHPTIVGSPGDWHCENCLRTFFPSGDTGAEQEAVLLRAALQTFVSRAKSWHNFHHGSEVIQCDLLCDAIPIGEAALSGNGSTPETTKNQAIPVAWMRGHRSHTPDGDDYDVECHYGDDPPDDKKWIPLYRDPPRHVYSSSSDLRKLLELARNFIVSNYVDGDLPAFDKPDKLCDEIIAALRGSDAPPSAQETTCDCPPDCQGPDNTSKLCRAEMPASETFRQSIDRIRRELHELKQPVPDETLDMSKPDLSQKASTPQRDPEKWCKCGEYLKTTPHICFTDSSPNGKGDRT